MVEGNGQFAAQAIARRCASGTWSGVDVALSVRKRNVRIGSPRQAAA
jgi:hypothetical protein